MPRRDGTGPMGRGPMTGGGFGTCTGRGAVGQGSGRGMGRGGAGSGMQRMFRMFQSGGRFGANAPDQGLENQSLMRENEALRSELNAIKKRLDDMEGRTENAR